jgi:tRNA 2-thiouridine synthesizing protein A
MTQATETQIDALGQACPWPLILAKQALKTLAAGATLCVVSDDPLAELDLAALCARDGHAFLGATARAALAPLAVELRIRKGT